MQQPASSPSAHGPGGRAQLAPGTRRQLRPRRRPHDIRPHVKYTAAAVRCSGWLCPRIRWLAAECTTRRSDQIGAVRIHFQFKLIVFERVGFSCRDEPASNRPH